MATLTIITSGVEWSRARARDFGCEYVDPATSERLAARLVKAFDRRTGLIWDVQKGIVYGPEDWAGDPAELHAIREDASDGVFAAFMEDREEPDESANSYAVIVQGPAWQRDQIGADAADWRRHAIQSILRADEAAGEDSENLCGNIVSDFNCRTGLTWNPHTGEVTAPNGDVYDYWSNLWDTIEAVRREIVSETVIDYMFNVWPRPSPPTIPVGPGTMPGRPTFPKHLEDEPMGCVKDCLAKFTDIVCPGGSAGADEVYEMFFEFLMESADPSTASKTTAFTGRTVEEYVIACITCSGLRATADRWSYSDFVDLILGDELTPPAITMETMQAIVDDANSRGLGRQLLATH